MKRVYSVMVVFLLGVGLTLTGCASNEISQGRTLAKTEAMDSVDFHMTALQNHQDRAAQLEQKIQKIQARIQATNEKPYRDPKGFRRSGWKRLVGTWKLEMNALQEQVAWHKNEITRLRASTKEPDSAGQQGSKNS